MKQHVIGVTGVGGGVGQSIIKSLYETGYHLIGLDGDLLAAGIYALPEAYKIPYASSASYIPELLNICAKKKIDLLFPGLDAELMPLSENRDVFSRAGTTVVVSRPDVIEIADNKMLTSKRLSTFGIKVPETLELSGINAGSHGLAFPLIIKQKAGGARSKNVFLIKTQSELDAFFEEQKQSFSQFVVQEFIEGDEYTCGSVNMDGVCKGVIVMRRILRDGDTYKCFVEDHPVIEETVRNVMKAIQPFGACNVQLRIRDGVPYVFEINARCSGTTASRTLCGFNEPKMIADYLLKKLQPSFAIKKQTILRYWKELVVQNDDVEFLKTTGKIIQPHYSKL